MGSPSSDTNSPKTNCKCNDMGKLRMWSFILPSVVIVLVVIFTVLYVTLSRRASGVVGESLPKADSTLVLAHILFRHGNRAPGEKQYPKNPFNSESYFPEGYGQLSEDGKKVAYRIGTTLHQRYNWFLGPTWNINYIAARSTDITRTQMSLQLMLAGLWPPTGHQIIDPSLNWQPIPFDFNTEDKELAGDKICKNFVTMTSEVENSPEIRQALSIYDGYWEYFSNVSGKNVTVLQDAFDICMDQIAQLTYGYPLEDWVVEAMPILQKMAKDVYYIETNTTQLRQIAGGYLLKKMITDSKDMIDGVIAPLARKMFIYSAHERNIAHFLILLGLYEDDIPAYGTHILVELHLVGGVYGFKIYIQNWSTSAPKLMTIPGCEAFCPFDEFVSLYQEVLPEDDFCIL